MLNKLTIILFTLLFGVNVYANDIYIDQVGDSLDLDIVQDGQNNKIGTALVDADFDGDNMTFSITQTGNTNEITADIQGNTYTGTWVFTGNSNTVDLLCDSSANGNCETVTLNITNTGDSNAYTINIGETGDAENATIAFTVTGDNSVINTDVDGTNSDITVVMNNSASLATTSANSDEGNQLDLTQTGNGDSAGHSITLNITGGGSTYTVTQSGIYDNKVDATFNGDSQDVDITQRD
jgi:hypothetical protein